MTYEFELNYKIKGQIVAYIECKVEAESLGDDGFGISQAWLAGWLPGKKSEFFIVDDADILVQISDQLAQDDSFLAGLEEEYEDMRYEAAQESRSPYLRLADAAWFCAPQIL